MSGRRLPLSYFQTTYLIYWPTLNSAANFGQKPGIGTVFVIDGQELCCLLIGRAVCRECLAPSSRMAKSQGVTPGIGVVVKWLFRTGGLPRPCDGVEVGVEIFSDVA